MYRTGHDIARRQLGIVMNRLHESVTRAVDQDRPLAAQGFGAQGRRVEARIERGRVELDEFRVLDFGTEPRGHRHRLALSPGRRRGQREQTASPAHGEDGLIGLDFNRFARGGARDRTGTITILAGDQARRCPAIADLDMPGGPHGGDQGLHDRGASPVAGHTGDAVA